MHHLLEIWFGWVKHGGYLGIIVLMAMESSIIPIPSEIVIPPAAFLAARGDLNLTGVIIAGTVGSYLGAAFGYWLCLLIGRPLLYRFGKYFLLTTDKLERAEIWLSRYETSSLPDSYRSFAIPFPTRRVSSGWIFGSSALRRSQDPRSGAAFWLTWGRRLTKCNRISSPTSTDG